MPRSVQNELASIVEVVRQYPEGVRRSEIEKTLTAVPQRTLQYRLQRLVGDGQLLQEGKGPAARYRIARVAAETNESTVAFASTPEEETSQEAFVPLSAAGLEIRTYLQQPQTSRKAVGYNRAFLDVYRPKLLF